MTNRQRILTNLFVSRIRKNQSTIDDVQDNVLPFVQEKLKTLEEECYRIPREGESEDPPINPVDDGFSPDGPLIGNIQSKVFHAYDCVSLPAERNQKEISCFSSFNEAVEAGFRPCRNCNPRT